MKNIFIGYAVDNEFFNSVQLSSNINYRQTFNFSHAFLDFLKFKNVDCYNLSFSPFNAYGLFFSRIFIFVVYFIRSFSIFKELVRVKPDNVFVHGLSLFHIFPVSCYSLFNSSTNAVVLLTDPVNVKINNKFLRFLKLFYLQLIKFFLKSFDSSLSLSNYLSLDYLPNKPSVTVPGFFPFHTKNLYDSDSSQLISNHIKSIFNKEDGSTYLLYAGGISQEYGVGQFLDDFIKYSSDNVHLIVCGSGSLSEYFSKIEFKRFHYLGFLQPEELYYIYSNIDVFINPRPSNSNFSKNSSPSKLFEFALFDKVIFTSNLESYPEYFNEFLYYFPDSTSFKSFFVNEMYFVKNNKKLNYFDVYNFYNIDNIIIQ